MVKKNELSATYKRNSDGNNHGQGETWRDKIAATPHWAIAAAKAQGEPIRSIWLAESYFEKHPSWPGVVKLVCRNAAAATFCIENFKAAAVEAARQEFPDMEQLLILPRDCTTHDLRGWCYSSDLRPERLAKPETVLMQIEKIAQAVLEKKFAMIRPVYVEESANLGKWV